MEGAEPTVWFNGSLCPASAALISPFDHGLLTGDGVFETMRVYRGAPFAMTRHLERLRRSATGLGLPLPDPDTLRAACENVVSSNQLVDARLRITITGGVSPLGSERGAGPPTVVIAATPFAPWTPSVDVAVVPWTRNERSAVAGLKTISYAENVVALAFARQRGAGEAIFLNTSGQLCEGTGTNLFVAVGGELFTPPLRAGCLAGVTRDLLLERGVGREADLPADRLTQAGEAFLTSSTREIHPVHHVDGSSLPACPGPLTEAAQRAFAAILEESLDP